MKLGSSRCLQVWELGRDLFSQTSRSIRRKNIINKEVYDITGIIWNNLGSYYFLIFGDNPDVFDDEI